MYVPPHFEELDKDKLFDLIETKPLGVLITQGENGLDANHIPFELDRSQGEWGTLRCHVARKNPVWQDVETGLVGFISGKVRREWRVSDIDLVQVVSMQPGSRPGVVGVEIGVHGAEEEPVLAFEEYSREALDWLKEQREALRDCFGVEVPVVDYGRDG